jgi:four helix bundle protein
MEKENYNERKNLVREKAFEFSVRIIKLSSYLKRKGVEQPLRIQILKSGTSITANIEEGIAAISKAEFSAKLSISYKEARETLFWLKLFRRSDILTDIEFKSLHRECDEIAKLLFTIIRSSRRKT